jgi:uncharacterized protein YprB with RNaseH-like and TPR domain
VLRHTFIHVPGIGYATERRLWKAGITSWQDFFVSGEAPGLGPYRRVQLEQGLSASVDRLAEGDHRFFRRRLPSREYWRAYREFKEHTAYLDIETTGMEADRHEITLIGLYDGRRMRHYMEEEMEEFPRDLRQYKMIVTFNGASFDLPFLRRVFPGLQLHQIHIDLRHVMARLGLKGGLKAIERRVGIERTPRTRDVRGWDAVYLWRRYLKGDEEALDVLLEYNREDVVNLKHLMEMAYDSLRSMCLHHGFRTYSLEDLGSAEDRNSYSAASD